MANCEHCEGSGRLGGQDCGWCVRARAAALPKFGNVGANVIRGDESIATCRSASMAKRIAAALNWYKPGPRGT
jgi:hypothetical protein